MQRLSLAEGVNISVLKPPIGSLYLDAAIEAVLKPGKEMLKLLGGFILGFCEEHAAVIGLVVNEIDHVPIAVAICRRNWPLQIRANNSANSIDW